MIERAQFHFSLVSMANSVRLYRLSEPKDRRFVLIIWVPSKRLASQLIAASRSEGHRWISLSLSLPLLRSRELWGQMCTRASEKWEVGSCKRMTEIGHPLGWLALLYCRQPSVGYLHSTGLLIYYMYELSNISALWTFTRVGHSNSNWK